MQEPHAPHRTPVVLLVDDDAAQLRTLAGLLREELPDVDILTTDNGAEALRRLRRERIDVLVTDVAMPVLTGLEALAQHRYEGGRVRVVVMSGLVRPIASPEIDAWIEKPVDVGEMAHTIRRLLTS